MIPCPLPKPGEGFLLPQITKCLLHDPQGREDAGSDRGAWISPKEIFAARQLTLDESGKE